MVFEKGEVQPATNTAPTTRNARNKVPYDLFISKAPFGIVSDSTVTDSQQEQMRNSRVFIECLFYKSSAMLAPQVWAADQRAAYTRQRRLPESTQFAVAYPICDRALALRDVRNVQVFKQPSLVVA